MAKQKIDTFILRNDFFPQIKMLTREERGDLLTAIFAYSVGDELPDMDTVTQMCFGFIRASLDANSEKYQARCDKNRENGRRGGRPSDKANGSEDNRTVFEETERFSEEANETDGADEKPNANSGNPIVSDSYSYSDSKSYSESVSIPDTETRDKEREIFLKILLFEKKLLCPQTELDRFTAHYEKTGWVDANGNPIKNRVAALRSWSPAKDAVKCPARTAAVWAEVVEAAARADPAGDLTPMLTLFRGLYCEGPTLHITAADKSLADFMERRIRSIRPVFDKHFGPAKLNYRILRL